MQQQVLIKFGSSDVVSYVCRIEIEADHIGLLLLSAAGFHPYTSLIARWKLAKRVTETILEAFLSPYPSYKRRSQYLLQPKVMQKAMELYNEATTDQDVGNKSAQ
jgi:predicted Zn-dependent protease